MGKTTGRFGLRAGEPHRHPAAALPDSPLTAPNEGSDVARDKPGTRTATVPLAPGVRNVIGIGRVKMPTLAIPCRRELQIPDFVPVAYFEVVATARMRGETFWICHAPKEGIVERAKPPGPSPVACRNVLRSSAHWLPEIRTKGPTCPPQPSPYEAHACQPLQCRQLRSNRALTNRQPSRYSQIWPCPAESS